jgi:hypothetical protein
MHMQHGRPFLHLSLAPGGSFCRPGTAAIGHDSVRAFQSQSQISWADAACTDSIADAPHLYMQHSEYVANGSD